MRRKVAERVRGSPRGGRSTNSIRVVHCGSCSWKRVWTRKGARSAAVAMVLRRRSEQGAPPPRPGEE